VTPEDIDRALARDAAGVRASPSFAASVMAAVRREAKEPPPLPFPWTRAAPGIAAAVLTLGLAAWSFSSTPSAATAARAPEALVRAAELTASVGDVLVAWDVRWALIAAVVAALTVVPILAPFLFVRAERNAWPGRR
jgi:hypothetical protein